MTGRHVDATRPVDAPARRDSAVVMLCDVQATAAWRFPRREPARRSALREAEKRRTAERQLRAYVAAGSPGYADLRIDRSQDERFRTHLGTLGTQR